MEFLLFKGWNTCTHVLFIHSSVDDYLESFLHPCYCNNAAMNMEMWMSLWNPHLNSSGYILKCDCYNMVVLFFKFLRNLHTLFHSGCSQFTFLPPVHKGSRFSRCSQLLSLIFDNIHFNRCEVISPYDFWFAFPWWFWFDFFHGLFGHFYVFFKKISIESLCQILINYLSFCYLVV